MSMNTNQVRPSNVWTARISARQAREVAKALREAGYTTITIDRVRELGYVNQIAEWCEPGDISEQNAVRRIICVAAGIQPRQH